MEFNFKAFHRFILIGISIEPQLSDWCQKKLADLFFYISK